MMFDLPLPPMIDPWIVAAVLALVAAIGLKRRDVLDVVLEDWEYLVIGVSGGYIGWTYDVAGLLGGIPLL